jgi:murein DD-endopeptidase MepM/ murein hydrolase activator NlpD
LITSQLKNLAKKPSYDIIRGFFMKKIATIAIIFSAIGLSAYFAVITGKYSGQETNRDSFAQEAVSAADEIVQVEETERIVGAPVIQGKTFTDLMKAEGLEYSLAMEIYESAKDIYDLAKIREGKTVDLIFDIGSNELIRLAYKINTEEELFVRRQASPESGGKWTAEIKPIPYEVKIKTVSAEIKTSMYQAALDNEIDIRAIIELANAFQWTIDFAMDPRTGDEFSFVYEERYLNKEYAMPGRVLAGKYVNSGKEYFVYHFKESEDNIGFFDENGNSVQKMFLKAPLEFKYISSGFTTGLRYIEAFNVSTGHKAIDYAAETGTPIRAVGDGTITFAGWDSRGYGNMVSIRHNSTYSTNYAHQSKIAVKKGQKIKQGDIIGYVGSTGFSTGPHLHYEMIKNGAKINPLQEALPPGQPIKEENRERFYGEVERYKQMMKL